MATILVHPFSFKILKSDGLPYYLSTSDPLYEYFFSGRQSKELDSMTMPITFYFKGPANNQIPEGIASAIFRYHKRILFTWMKASLSSGGNAYRAMCDFYEKHDITDDDYDRDNMYREWLRYSRERKKPAFKNEQSPIRIVTKSKIDEAMEHISSLYIEDFLTKSTGKFNHFLYRQFYCYLLYEYARQPVKEIEKTTKLQRPTIWYSIRQTRKLLEVRHDMQLSCLNVIQ